LTPIEIALQEIVIAKPQKLIEIMIDKTLYNASIDPLNKNKTAFDVLKNTPMVQLINNDKAVLLNGLPATVLINNKEYPMLKSQLADYLSSQPASLIKQVEIIALPSAKYGSSGVINLIINTHSKTMPTSC
jgi:PHD/YefM family antitoxin component YafN of YafNO toxin-antitoxin module